MSDDLENTLFEAKRLYEAQRYEEAFEKYLRAAESGGTSAQWFVGQMYLLGKGTQQSDEEALKWYLAAAEKGYADAQCALGFFYHNKKHDTETAITWYEKAAAKGHMMSLWRLGKMFRWGIGVPADKLKALGYFERAAQKGHVFAQRELAVLLLQGLLGWSQIPRGVWLFVKCIVRGISITLRSEHDERLCN